MEHKNVVITRGFNASGEKLWKAWTEADQIKLWWSPSGYSKPSIRIEFKVGGRALYCMRSAEGPEVWSTGEFIMIEPKERFIVTDSFSDKDGRIVPASTYGLKGECPLKGLITVIFKEEEPGKISSILKHEGFPSEKDCRDAGDGWSQMFDKLEKYLEKSK